jgi:homocysteine S-methyltransferase
MAPPRGGRAPVDPVDLPREFAMQAKALKEGGADLLLIEYIGYVDDIVAAIDAVQPVGLPIMIGIRHIQDNGAMQAGESFDALVEALGSRRVDAILLMCSKPPAISAGLPLLRKAYNGPIGAYPNIGYRGASEAFGQGGQWHQLDTSSYSPAELARDGKAWLALGAQIVGGCCATTPAHIGTLRKVVPEARP